VASDRVAAAVAAAVADLYGGDPDAFLERRKALVAAAKEAGDKESAATIGALRKPTRAAWVVNQLARTDPDAAVRLAALAADLRAAERAKDGRRLRELSAERGSLLDGLVGQALAAAGTLDPPPSLRTEVTDTLTAALSDPSTAADFAAGRLTKAAQWGGFGYVGFPFADTADKAASSPDPKTADRSAPGRRPSTPAPIRLPRQADRAKRAELSSGPAETDLPTAERGHQRQEREQRERELREQRDQQRLAAEEQRRAQEAAERTARAREKFEDAERSLTQAATAATEALAVEDLLEVEVRQLEERLTQAREELATARLRARRAEAAERRAQQARDRLM
jgi:hypothetical protein